MGMFILGIVLGACLGFFFSCLCFNGQMNDDVTVTDSGLSPMERLS